MGIISITSEIRYNNLYIYVTAEKGTHHSTIASAALKHSRELEQPEYVSTVTGTRQGEWCSPSYFGPWKRVGSDITADSHVRKYFSAWPVPKQKESN